MVETMVRSVEGRRLRISRCGCEQRGVVFVSETPVVLVPMRREQRFSGVRDEAFVSGNLRCVRRASRKISFVAAVFVYLKKRCALFRIDVIDIPVGVHSQSAVVLHEYLVSRHGIELKMRIAYLRILVNDLHNAFLQIISDDLECRRTGSFQTLSLRQHIPLIFGDGAVMRNDVARSFGFEHRPLLQRHHIEPDEFVVQIPVIREIAPGGCRYAADSAHIVDFHDIQTVQIDQQHRADAVEAEIVAASD